MKRPEKNLIQNATVKPWKHLDGSLIQSPNKDKRNVSVDARQTWYVGLTLIHSTLLDVHLERCFSLAKYHVNLNNQFRVPRVRNVYIHIFARINSRLIVVVGTYTLPKITSRDLQQRDSMVSLSPWILEDVDFVARFAPNRWVLRRLKSSHVSTGAYQPRFSVKYLFVKANVA